MGGETIRDILDSGKARLNGRERLILQPNGGEQPLRVWLMENGYRIVCEEVLRENRFDYEIIIAEPDGPVTYTAQDAGAQPGLPAQVAALAGQEAEDPERLCPSAESCTGRKTAEHRAAGAMDFRVAGLSMPIELMPRPALKTA